MDGNTNEPTNKKIDAKMPDCVNMKEMRMNGAEMSSAVPWKKG